MIVAIYNVWDGLELLRASIDNIIKCGVDKVIIVYSDTSNYGDVSKFPLEHFQDCVLVNHEPDVITLWPGANELGKRNTGLEKAKELGAEMFIMMDADEFYFESEFKAAIKILRNSDYIGLVCKSIVYFGRPTLSIGFDTTYVTHLHKLKPEMEYKYMYPYPFEAHDGVMRIDPTRRLNINAGVYLAKEIVMHHYSWVRKDYNQKINNSSARCNLELIHNDILKSIENAKEGHVCALYNKELTTVPDYFGLSQLF